MKWKDKQVLEITWKYWLHTKHDCVDQVEKCWLQQKAPDPDKVKRNMKSHPTMHGYKKLLESPVFGKSYIEQATNTVGTNICI